MSSATVTSMQRHEIGLTADLLEMIIRKDYAALCAEVDRRWLQVEPVSLWLYHRWNRDKGAFSLVYPTLSKPLVQLPTPVRAHLEKQESLVDNNRPESYGRWAETGDHPFTVLLPLLHNSDFVGAIQGFSETREGLDGLAQRLEAGLCLTARSWYLIHLLEEKEKLAFTDTLTGLFNYQFLRQFLENELMRCARYHKPVSVLFMDVDWFKRVNDAHGHLIGSYVLKELGKLLRGQVREADIVARYGGDEYVVVLTETGVEAAHHIAERLRQAVSAQPLGGPQRLSIPLTISIGVAAFPAHGRTTDELIRRSDIAMYCAKECDKNCVKIAG